MDNIILAGLLGVGVAMASGFRAFMPMLMLAIAERTGFAGIDLGSDFAWLSSDIAILALAIAAVVEFAADKIPVVDSFLDVAGILVRPAVGTLGAMASFSSADPAIPSLIAIIALPTTGAVQLAKGKVRVASTASTGGLGSPILSIWEDILSFLTVFIALLAPILIPVVAFLIFLVIRRIFRFLCRKLSEMRDIVMEGPKLFRSKVFDSSCVPSRVDVPDDSLVLTDPKSSASRPRMLRKASWSNWVSGKALSHESTRTAMSLASRFRSFTRKTSIGLRGAVSARWPWR